MADLPVLMTRRTKFLRPLASAVLLLAVAILTLIPPASAQDSTPTTTPASKPATSGAPPDPLGEAKALMRQGSFDAAIECYQRLLKEKPKSPDAYAGLTRAYLKKKDVAQANETVTKALQVTDAWPVHVALGEVYFRQGKITDAEKEWVGVINSGHPSARAYLGLARTRWAIEMNKSAKAMIDKAHELDPNDPDIQQHWVRTLPRSERIKFYEAYLAAPNSSDAEERANTERYLAYLKARAKQPGRYCHLVSKVSATDVPLLRLLLNPEHLRGYGLSVVLNGTKTKLMLDTGASGILVNRNVAERAGIAKISESRIWGIGDKGPKSGYVGIADTIRIGELEFQDCSVRVMDSRSVAGEDGLIGSNVFEKFLIELNFPAEKMKLSELPKPPGQSDQPLALKNDEDESSDQEAANKQPESKDATSNDAASHESKNSAESDAKKIPPPINSSGPQDRYISPEMGSYSHVYRFGHHLLIPTKIGDAPPKLFLLDTGAVTNSISPEAAAEVTKINNSNTIVKGLNGSVDKVYSANKAVLQFGRLRQENQDMVAFDMSAMSDGHGTEVSGFLGFVLLKFLDIKIDYRDALVDFTYDKTQFNHF